MSPGYYSRTVRKETLNTVSLVLPHVGPEASVLDVGCGEGYVGDELAARGLREVQGVDIGDFRLTKAVAFALYDGLRLPFPEGRFDLVMLTFVLHHVPDPLKTELLREALRVARVTVFILEDTPTTAFDRVAARVHGEDYRKRINSAAPFGFLTPGEWLWLFRGMGFEAESHSLGRFCRSVLQPFARTAFVLRKPPAVGVPPDVVRIPPRARDESSSRPIAPG